MPNPRGRGSDRDETRRKLIDAAMQVFAERGFAGATLEEIAAAAGFTRGALYSNFANKDELFLAVFDRQNMTAATAVASLLRSGMSFLDVATADPMPVAQRRLESMVRLEFDLYAARRPELAKRLRAMGRERRKALAEVVADEVERRGVRLRVSADDAAWLIFAVNTQLALETVLRGSRPTESRARYAALFEAIGLE